MNKQDFLELVNDMNIDFQSDKFQARCLVSTMAEAYGLSWKDKKDVFEQLDI